MQTTARLPNIMFSAILFCHGRLAQRLAQVLYTHKAGGSNPSSPTTDTEGLPPVGGEAFCHLETSVPRAGSSISTRTTTGAAPPPTSSAPRRHGRLVAPSSCRRIGLATSSPSRHTCLVAALSSRFFCTISPKLVLFTKSGHFCANYRATAKNANAVAR